MMLVMRSLLVTVLLLGPVLPTFGAEYPEHPG